MANALPFHMPKIGPKAQDRMIYLFSKKCGSITVLICWQTKPIALTRNADMDVWVKMNSLTKKSKVEITLSSVEISDHLFINIKSKLS